eukprot:1156204-Pelagomonas_calceolata.AAC.13
MSSLPVHWASSKVPLWPAACHYFLLQLTHVFTTTAGFHTSITRRRRHSQKQHEATGIVCACAATPCPVPPAAGSWHSQQHQVITSAVLTTDC